MHYESVVGPRALAVAAALVMTACSSGGVSTPTVLPSQQGVLNYQNVRAYLPAGVAQYKAAIVFLPGLRDPATGNPLDSRGLVGGPSSTVCSIWCTQAEISEIRRRSLQLAGGQVALIGTTTLVDQPASYETLLRALAELAAESRHPELASIPLLFVGHSMGGCTAYGFSRAHGERVAGFITMKGACHNTGPALAAAGVPGYFLIGALDEPYRRDNITAVFEAGRAGAAPWALSTDSYHHGPIVDLDLMFDWMEEVLAARVPASAGSSLHGVVESNGWLGDRSNGTISTYACHTSNRLRASWLPSRRTALNWQRMAGGSAVVSAC